MIRLVAEVVKQMYIKQHFWEAMQLTKGIVKLKAD